MLSATSSSLQMRSILLKDFTDKVEELGGLGYQSFLDAVEYLDQESRPFELDNYTPSFPLEIAKAAAQRETISITLSVDGESSIDMVSEPVLPGEPIRVEFKQDKASDILNVSPDFRFIVQLKGTPFRKDGVMFLKAALDAPNTRGGVKSEPGTVTPFKYNFYSAFEYEFYQKHHIPTMSAYFFLRNNGVDEKLTVEGLRLVVYYQPREIAPVLDQGLTSAYDVTRIPAQLLTVLPRTVGNVVSPIDFGTMDAQIVEDLNAMQLPSLSFAYLSSQSELGNKSLVVPWGSITDLAIIATILKLNKDNEDMAIDSPAFLEAVFTENTNDRRGRELLSALTRLYGAKENFPTVRQLIMHTSGLTEHLPESFYHKILDIKNRAAEFMAHTPIFSILPSFSSTDEDLETDLIVMLNTMSPLKDLVAGLPFPVNVSGSTLYDYAILAMIIKRLSKDEQRSAQDVIKVTLGLKDVLHWNLQYSRSGESTEEGPTTIYTLGNGAYSDAATLSRFIRSLSADTDLNERLVRERVYDVSREDADEEGIFRTLVWQGVRAESNPIPIYFRDSGHGTTTTAIVYVVPDLQHYGVLATSYAGALDMPARLLAMVTGRVSSVATQVAQVAEDAVLPVEAFVGEMLARTTDDLQEQGPLSIGRIIKVGDVYTSPFVNPITNQAAQVVVEASTENPDTRLNLVAKGSNFIAARLVLDQPTGHIYAMGEKIDADSNIRTITPSPVTIDSSKFVGKDNVYYRNPKALPVMTKIEENVSKFQRRFNDTPVHMLVGGSLAAASSSPHAEMRLESLVQNAPKRPFTQLPISCSHSKRHYRSYVQSSSRQPYSSQFT